MTLVGSSPRCCYFALFRAAFISGEGGGRGESQRGESNKKVQKALLGKRREEERMERTDCAEA